MKKLWFTVVILIAIAGPLNWHNHQYVMVGINLLALTIMLYWHPFRRP